jgi:transcriptional regulator with XRE-family HTH domain
MARKRKTERPEWAEKITALRKHLGLSQGEFGRRIDCSAMTVSRWESAQQPPTAEHYIRLGRIAGNPDCWFFWESAGLRSEDVVRTLPDRMRRRLPVSAMPEMEIANAGPGPRRSVGELSPLVAVPMLTVSAGTPGCIGDKKSSLARVGAARVLGAPREWCPNPAYISLVRCKGRSMEPLIHDGDIVAVDSFQTERDDLDGKVVLVSSEEKGLCISRYRHYDTVDILEPENHHEFDSTVLKKGSGWEIIGKVLWWVTEAP